MTHLCPSDGTELHLHYVGYVMNDYDCPKCGKHFKGFAGDADQVIDAKSPTETK